MNRNGFVFDIEADNFYLQSKEIWYVHFRSLDNSMELELWPFRDGKEYCRSAIMDWMDKFESDPLVVSFNGLGYDSWMFWKHFDIPFHVGKQGKDWMAGKSVQFYDLYVLSQYLDPDRPRHSLASYGEEFGDAKIDFHDFSGYSEEMRIYCKQDSSLTLKVYNHLTAKAEELYKKWPHDSFRMTQKDYYLYAAQAYSGIKFDKEAAQKLVEHIDVEMAKIETDVLPRLPARKLKLGEQKLYTMPAKPYKKDGTFSSHMINFIEKHNGEQVDATHVKFYDKVYEVVGGNILDVTVPMEIKDGDEIKEWFISQGWVPTMYNFQRDPNTGKPMRDPKTNEPITTTPKIQEQGKICPNLLKLNGELPKQIVKYLSYRNRRSVIEGWLNNWRLDFDGRISAEISGFTPTFRVKHKVITNLPKASAEVLLGYEVRSLFIVDNDMKYVSADAAALENRTVADFTYKYDGGKFADLVLNGDSHSFNAKIFFPRETAAFDIESPEFNKDDPGFKPWRNKAKTGAYSLAYGASEKKFTKSLGLSPAEGKIAYENYWNANEGLKLFKEAVSAFWEHRGQKKRIISRDGRWLSVRSKHLLVNLCGQNLGATVMTLAACMVDNWLGWLDIDEQGRPYYTYKGRKVIRTAFFHDQIDFEADPEVAEEVGKMIVKGIKKAGEFLKMSVELDGEYKVGNNAAEIH